MKLTAETEDFDAELPHRIFLAGGNVVRMFDIVEGEREGIHRTFDAWELFNEAEFRRVTLHDMYCFCEVLDGSLPCAQVVQAPVPSRTSTLSSKSSKISKSLPSPTSFSMLGYHGIPSYRHSQSILLGRSAPPRPYLHSPR